MFRAQSATPASDAASEHLSDAAVVEKNSHPPPHAVPQAHTG